MARRPNLFGMRGASRVRTGFRVSHYRRSANSCTTTLGCSKCSGAKRPVLTLIILSVGITHVWARGTIFKRARALWPELLDCPLCAGVWISILVQVGLVYATTFTVALGIACVSASLSLALYGLIRAIPVRSLAATRESPRALDGRGAPSITASHVSLQSNEDAAWEAGKGRGYT